MGNFHYTLMLLVLKNVEVTYQRSMTTNFHDILHDFVEAYIDDIVLKAREVHNHVDDLEKSFLKDAEDTNS